MEAYDGTGSSAYTQFSKILLSRFPFAYVSIKPAVHATQTVILSHQVRESWRCGIYGFQESGMLCKELEYA